MGTTRKAHPLLELGVRIVADAVMVNLSLAMAMLGRYIIEIWAVGGGPPRDILLQ